MDTNHLCHFWYSMMWRFSAGNSCHCHSHGWYKMAYSVLLSLLPCGVLLPRPCQGVMVYLSFWHCVGLSVSICLHPSVLTPVRQTIRVNQFFAHPVCQSFCLWLFVCSLYHRVSLSVTLSPFPPSIHSSSPSNLLGWSRTFGFYCDSTSFVHLQMSMLLSIPSCFRWVYFVCLKRWIVSPLTPVVLYCRQVNCFWQSFRFLREQQ